MYRTSLMVLRKMVFQEERILNLAGYTPHYEIAILRTHKLRYACHPRWLDHLCASCPIYGVELIQPTWP